MRSACLRAPSWLSNPWWGDKLLEPAPSPNWTRSPATIAHRVWAYDFVFDACANGQQLKCLTVIDEYTREALAIDVAGSLRSARVIEVLAQLITVHGAPHALKNGKLRDECLSME